MVQKCVGWRDDGLFRLIWQGCYLLWTRGRLRTFPPDRFVGQAYGSLAVVEPNRFHLRSIRLHRLPRKAGISSVRLWRLICEWETHPLPSRHPLYGKHLVPVGRSSEDAGVGDSSLLTGTTSISTRC